MLRPLYSGRSCSSSPPRMVSSPGMRPCAHGRTDLHVCPYAAPHRQRYADMRRPRFLNSEGYSLSMRRNAQFQPLPKNNVTFLLRVDFLWLQALCLFFVFSRVFRTSDLRLQTLCSFSRDTCISPRDTCICLRQDLTVPGPLPGLCISAIHLKILDN